MAPNSDVFAGHSPGSRGARRETGGDGSSPGDDAGVPEGYIDGADKFYLPSDGYLRRRHKKIADGAFGGIFTFLMVAGSDSAAESATAALALVAAKGIVLLGILGAIYVGILWTVSEPKTTPAGGNTPSD